MQEIDYTNTTVLLFDRNGPVLRQTMSMLNALGFKKFLEVQELTATRQILDNQRLEIAILALEATDCGVLKLVDEIRQRRCGLDPFVPILLTAWDARLKSVRLVIDSGVDDILLHPFSISRIGKRIEALVNARKPFVITETYFGPDRRASLASRADSSSIIVPNALRARVRGHGDAAPDEERIEAAYSDLRRLKLRNVARRIWFLANCLKESLPDPSLPYRYEDELTKVRNSIRMYQKTLAPGDDVDLASPCDSLSGVLAGLFGRPPNAERLELLEQSALALRAASQLDNENNDGDEVIRGQVADKDGKAQVDLIRAVMG